MIPSGGSRFGKTEAVSPLEASRLHRNWTSLSRFSPGSSRRVAATTFKCGAHRVTVLPGDGIGPEIADVAIRVLVAAGKAEGEEFEFTEALIGGAAIDATGQPCPEETLDTCRNSDAVLLPAVGGWVS